MSHPDSKSDGSSFKKTGKGRDRRGRSGPGNKGGPKTSIKSLNSDEAVPMLKYGPYNNFIVFKERLKTACMEKYGDLARLIELEMYWEPDPIDKDQDYPTASSDEFVKAALIHAHQGESDYDREDESKPELPCMPTSCRSSVRKVWMS
jgi:hypothetical protein